MYGTVARMKVAAGQEQAFEKLGEHWSTEFAAASGQVAEYVFRLDGRPGEYLLVAIFPDRASYRANAENPATDQFYRQMRALLAADPEWNDGEVVHAQVLQGI
ncbi:MAG: hypothetical protein DCC58_16290 [Chloroflexi bacterium]|nr:MAG: hypothetical protein DCC58_16290 [Chloroflexota bacterium]